MWIDIDFKYGEPVVASVYHKDGVQFMKSEVRVKAPKRPSDDCTEVRLAKWKEKTVDKISSTVLKSLPKDLYGTININIKGLE